MTLTYLEKVKPQKGSLENGRPAAWHTLSRENTFLKLQTRLAGLSDDQVNQRRQEFGPNTLPVKQPPALAGVFLHQFLSPLIYILVAAGGISLMLSQIKDALFIFGVVLLNAGIGMVHEWQAERNSAALQDLLKLYVQVRRGGVERWITTGALVPGDIVLLKPGNRIPADLRLIQANDLAIDESFLTGESRAVYKSAAPLTENVPAGERSNIAFAGSTIISGNGMGVVVATGRRTEVSRIAETITSVEVPKPLLLLRMEQLARQTGLIMLGASILLAMMALAKGMLYAEIFLLAVALAVSIIPIGLPVTTMTTLCIAAARLARRDVIVRRLAAVENLGRCTYIASGKTGALTVNKPAIKLIYLPPGERFSVSDEGTMSEVEVLTNPAQPQMSKAWSRLKHLVRTAVLCNEAQLVYQERALSDHGDAIDLAFLALAHKLWLHPLVVRGEIKTVDLIPFEPERGYTAHFYQDKSRVRVAVKGAVETVLPLCQCMQTGRGIVAINPAVIEQEALTWAENSYQVLAVAEGEVADSVDMAPVTEANIPPLTLLGLVGLIDPLRPEVKSAVEKCRQAGVEVVMVTGDHPVTALAMAREIGIAAFKQHVVTGRQLAEIGSPEAPQFLERVKSARVFARVPPRQKLHIVEALAKLGHVVTVTGDRLNDVPALRRANIGIALGSGTELAKDAALIIIAGDNFTSIGVGIEEGRFAYAKMRQITCLLLSTGVAEVILFIPALLTDLPLPLLAAQLLWLNVVINGIQGAALAFESGEPGVTPHRSTREIFDKRMARQTAISGVTMGLIAYGTWYSLLQAGWAEAAARNWVLLLMVLGQNFHVFNCCSEDVSVFKLPLRRNILLAGGVIAALGLHLLVLQLPFMQGLLRVAPVTPVEFFYLLLLASPVLGVVEVFKLFSSAGRRHKSGSGV